VGIFRDCSKF